VSWTLIGPDGRPYASRRPGTLGGHPFFLNERDARAAGYRPCAVCLPEKYATWRKKRSAQESRAD
jgi:methylphosphotriester-DNA--protein-cysteine methyltransferase